MNLLQQFVNFLLNQKNTPSLSTVKNYKADIGQFICWFEKEFNSYFDPTKVTQQILQKYRQARNLSGRSMERHTSSLHKFFSFLKLKKIILQDPLEKRTVPAEVLAQADPWRLRNFKNFLYEYKKSNLTIKNYITDIKSFLTWLDEVALVKYVWNVAERNLLDKINFPVVQEYKQRLIEAKFSPATINRKLSSLRNYISWAKSQGLISENSEERSENQNIRPSDNQTVQSSEAPSLPSIPSYSSFPPTRLMQKSARGINFLFDSLVIFPLAQVLEVAQYLFWKITGKKIFRKNISKSFRMARSDEIVNIKKSFYAPLNISIHYLPAHKRIWHYIRHVRPNWYKRYHQYSFAHYLHFAILMIVSCAVGFGMYNSLFVNVQQTKNAILGASTSVPPRILSFQGKLTDSSETPIVKETAILFSLYGDENASAEAALWQENDVIKPDLDGVFSVLLGKKIPIPDTTFSQNSRLFLGITVGQSPELRPRQELATVPFAANSETLQGLEPITNSTKVSNVVLALDSSGNLSIAGAKAHTFQAIGGNLILSGKVLSLTTAPGSNSNIEISPDGIGKIDFSKPIQNSTNNNNLTSAVGSVEFDDTVAILATTSAQAALYINQNSTGVLISASTSGTAKFVVENDGTGKFTGDLAINGGDITSTSTTFNLLNSTVTTLNIGNSGGTTVVKSNLTVDKDFTLPSLTSNGGILYTNGSGKIYQVTAGSSSDCLMGGTTPSFSSCSGTNIFNQTSGAIYPNNITSDLLLGATSTASALIKLTGTNVAGANNSWFNAGSVGIGTTAPSFKLDVQNSQSSTAAAQIYNTSTATTADGLIVKLGNIDSTIDNANHFISFETSGIGIVGSVRGNGTGVQYQTSGIADFAEYFKKDHGQAIEYGSVICLADNGLAVKCDNDHNQIIGVASEHPAFLGGKNLGNASIAVGLIGQVETFVAITNGEIKAGDMLTASDIPGIAIKTTKAGQIIGKALEDLTIIDESKIVGYYDPDNKEYRNKVNFPDIPLKSNIVRVAKIPASINISWYDPGAYLAQNGDLEIVSSSMYHVSSIGNENPNDSPILNTYYLIRNTSKELIERVGAFTELMVANLHAGLVNASKIVTDSLIVTSDTIIINGQSLKDYIVNVIKNSEIVQSEIISPVVNVDQLATNIISPLGESLIVKLASPSAEIQNSEFIIQNSTGSAVASIDSMGKIAANSISVNQASISGNLNASDASISGTLRAGNIFAESIQGLTNFTDIASYSGQFAYVQGLKAEQAQFNQGLMVFGPASLSDTSIIGNLSVADRFSIGNTLFIAGNSIETLGTDLSLQSLKQGGLSIMGGLVKVDTEGNVKIQGNLAVNNANGLSVLSVNQTGDLVASGSGTFAKLNFNLIQPVLAVSDTEVIASSSAGIANISPYQSELTIRNALVTDKSVIYITPVGTPSAQAPFLMRQVPNDSFTVGVQSPTNHFIDFNWLIIN